MAKFKVGDRVKVHYIEGYSSPSKKFVDGTENIIRDIKPSRFNNDDWVYRLTNDFEWCWSEKELELVKPKFDHMNYTEGKYVIHTKTYEAAKTFERYIKWHCRHWDSARSWYINREDTCYNVNLNTYSGIKYYKMEGYTVLEFEDFDWSDFEMKKEFTKKDLKNGDVVLRRDGTVGVFVSDLRLFIDEHGTCSELAGINDDLICSVNSDRDVTAVRRINCCYGNPFRAFIYGYGTLVYERKEVEEMTLEEVCKALGKEIKIVKEK